MGFNILSVSALTIAMAFIVPAISSSFWEWYYARKKVVTEITKAQVKVKVEEVGKTGDTGRLSISSN